MRYVYRGEVDVQPQHLQSFLRTADSLKIKGLADQGIQDQPPSDQQSFKSESEPEVEPQPPISGTKDINPVLDQLQHCQPPSTPKTTPRLGLLEPLKVPIPPTSHYKRSDSNRYLFRSNTVWILKNFSALHDLREI